jgi:hypothetical protein
MIQFLIRGKQHRELKDKHLSKNLTQSDGSNRYGIELAFSHSINKKILIRGKSEAKPQLAVAFFNEFSVHGIESFSPIGLGCCQRAQFDALLTYRAVYKE